MNICIEKNMKSTKKPPKANKFNKATRTNINKLKFANCNQKIKF